MPRAKKPAADEPEDEAEDVAEAEGEIAEAPAKKRRKLDRSRTFAVIWGGSGESGYEQDGAEFGLDDMERV